MPLKKECSRQTRLSGRIFSHTKAKMFRGRLSVKDATDWAGEEDWMRARKRKSTLDKYPSSRSSLTE